MLKLTYTENDFYLERLAGSLEEWVTARMILALRASTPLYIQPSTASFLLPTDLPQMVDLEKVVRKEFSGVVGLSNCDSEYVEVTLEGTWLVSAPESEEGVFVAVMSYAVEFFLFTLWQEAQTKASVFRE